MTALNLNFVKTFGKNEAPHFDQPSTLSITYRQWTVVFEITKFAYVAGETRFA